jgi:hypothetical protein
MSEARTECVVEVATLPAPDCSSQAALSGQMNETHSSGGFRPIDISKQVRTTALCLNRFLHEPGLVNLIQEYYSGILMSDVIHRAKVIINDFSKRTRDELCVRTSMQELTDYVRYYSESLEFMSEIMSHLGCEMEANALFLEATRHGIVASLLDLFMQATNEHVQELGAYFINIVSNSLDEPDPESIDHFFTEWNRRFIERLMESEAVKRLLHMVSRSDLYQGLKHWHRPAGALLCALMIYLGLNPGHPRRDLLVPDVLADIVSLIAARVLLRAT